MMPSKYDPENPFADLESDLDAAPMPERRETEADRMAKEITGGHTTNTSDKRYPCERCRGRGVVTFGYVNIRQGKCHACRGRGFFKTSPEQRAQSKAAKRERARVEAKSKFDEAIAFLDANPEIRAWLNKNDGRFDFATSMQEALFKYGKWTEKQEAAVRRCVARDAEREAEARKKAERPVTGLDLRHVPSGYYAVPNGETRLKVKIDNVTEGKWAGYIFVRDGAVHGRGDRYGCQKPGQAYGGKIVEQLRIIAKDPRAASIAYGKLVGRCGVCGRVLENETSVEEGIGPVCASRLGW